MSSFKDASFAARQGTMGDEAEGVFDSLYPNHHKLGLNRPPLSVSKLTLKQRNTPDRMDENALVECLGVGRDQIVKVRVSKLIALIQWEATDVVDVFVWDSHKRRHCRGPVDAWIDASYQHGTYDLFPEGVPYVGLHTKFVPYEWVKA